MRIKNSIAALVAVAVVAIIAADASGMYNPATGTFLQRDPGPGAAIRIGGGAAALYEYVGGNPAARLDPFGLEWKIHRAGQKTAEVEGDCDDTVNDLAKKTNMDPDKFIFWLKATDGLKLPKTKGEKIGEGVGPASQPEGGGGKWPRRFTVPNTVFIGVGDMNWLSNKLTGSTPGNIRDILKGKEFFVDYKDWRDTGKWHAEDATAYSSSDLYGLVFFGHGVMGVAGKGKIASLIVFNKAQIGWLDPAGDGSSKYASPANFSDGQFGVLLLKSCDAEDGGWRKTASQNAQDAGAVWLGKGFEAAGATGGMEEAARNAK